MDAAAARHAGAQILGQVEESSLGEVRSLSPQAIEFHYTNTRVAMCMLGSFGGFNAGIPDKGFRGQSFGLSYRHAAIGAIHVPYS